MTLTLPDDPALAGFDEDDLRLELACALLSEGRVSRRVAARIAGVEQRTFDEEAFRRRIPAYTDDVLSQDVKALQTLFPE